MTLNVQAFKGDPDGTLTVTPLDKAGNPTIFDSPPAWSESSEGKVITLTPAADGVTATLAFVGVGTSTVTIKATDTNGSIFDAEPVVVNVAATEAVSATVTYAPGTTAASSTTAAATVTASPSAGTGQTPAMVVADPTSSW